MDGYIFTIKGYRMLRECIFRTEKRLAQVTKLKSESGSGQDTWHDEGFKLSITDEMMWSKRLGELEKLFLTARLIKPEEQNDKVKIGVGVIIKYEDGTIVEYVIDGYLVEPEEGRLSIYGPLGRALLGAEEGDKRTVIIGNKKRIFFIEKIFSPSVAETRIINKEDNP